MDSLDVAPIIKYMKHWEIDKIVSYCKKKGWKIDIVCYEEGENKCI